MKEADNKKCAKAQSKPKQTMLLKKFRHFLRFVCKVRHYVIKHKTIFPNFFHINEIFTNFAQSLYNTQFKYRT